MDFNKTWYDHNATFLFSIVFLWHVMTCLTCFPMLLYS